MKKFLLIWSGSSTLSIPVETRRKTSELLCFLPEKGITSAPFEIAVRVKTPTPLFDAFLTENFIGHDLLIPAFVFGWL
jgi:hypothetical protein